MDVRALLPAAVSPPAVSPPLRSLACAVACGSRRRQGDGTRRREQRAARDWMHMCPREAHCTHWAEWTLMEMAEVAEASPSAVALTPCSRGLPRQHLVRKDERLHCRTAGAARGHAAQAPSEAGPGSWRNNGDDTSSTSTSTCTCSRSSDTEASARRGVFWQSSQAWHSFPRQPSSR
jgi:hypothetical protein